MTTETIAESVPESAPHAAQVVSSTGQRNIQSSFYRGRHLVKTNRAAHANSAVLRAVDHLQLNHYEATTCEVFDIASGVLHAVLKRRLSGDLEILYKREVQENM